MAVQKGSMLEVNHHCLYVETAGDETALAVVCLHQGLGTVNSWREQIPAFVKAGYRLVLYDRWGYGRSDPRPGLDMPDFEPDLDDLDALLEMLAIQSPILMGHSDGGTIALHYAARFPERVAALVTVAAHIYVEAKMIPGIRSLRAAFENEPRFRQGLERQHGEKTTAVFYGWFNGWHSPAVRGWDMRPELHCITCPLLVIQGEDDEHATPDHARDIAAAVPGSELWLAPGRRHMLPQENAQDFNQKVLNFLQRRLEKRNI